MKNITLIIRSVNERTEALCKKLLLDQGIENEALFIVREVPFSASMKKSFSTGIERNCKWTLCIDADVLPRPGSVAKMIEFAESQKKNVPEVQGFIMDKFFGGPRKGGFHLYRTSLLPKVMKLIPSEGVNIRPETYTLQQMAKKGYPRALVPYIVGIHDDEQYNFDIYRKAFVQAVKHLDRADLLVSHWKKHVEKDQDFKVALKAFSDSIMNTDQVYINSRQNLYKELFAQSGFDEKDELDLHNFTPSDIEKRIIEWDVDEKYYKYHPDSQGLDNRGRTFFRKVKLSLKKRGVGQTILVALSQSFTKIGKVLGSRIPE